MLFSPRNITTVILLFTGITEGAIGKRFYDNPDTTIKPTVSITKLSFQLMTLMQDAGLGTEHAGKLTTRSNLEHDYPFYCQRAEGEIVQFWTLFGRRDPREYIFKAEVVGRPSCSKHLTLDRRCTIEYNLGRSLHTIIVVVNNESRSHWSLEVVGQSSSYRELRWPPDCLGNSIYELQWRHRVTTGNYVFLFLLAKCDSDYELQLPSTSRHSV